MKRMDFAVKYAIGIVLFALCSRITAQEVVAGDDKPMQCVTEEQYQEAMQKIISQRSKELHMKLYGDSIMAKMIGPTVPLAWPLKMAPDYDAETGVYSYFYISNFADLNHTEGSREDWMCNTGASARNYDQHNGVDIVPYPFPWQMMDDESVDIVAAADGHVLYTYDGNTVDRNCEEPHTFNDFEFNGGYYGNFVALEHSDGTVTIYAHMKNGTVADLEEDEFVKAGQYLGKIGSSGNSTAPHIHFEVRLCEACSYFEPWFDSEGCNDDITESWWIDQIPYREPQVLRVATHDVSPVYKDCDDYEDGSNEDVNFTNHFASFTTAIISVSMRDFLIGDAIGVSIYNASGTLMESFSYTSFSNYDVAVITFSESLSGYASGTYRVAVSHDGKTYDHYFTVNCTSAYIFSAAQSGHKGWIAGSTINSTSTISGVSTNQIMYEAGDFVKLNVGFKATQNCGFVAQIDPCTIGGTKEETLQEEPQANSLIVYPNPTFGAFDIVYFQDEEFDAQVIVRDQVGRIVYESEWISGQQYVKEHIDLSHFPKGIYYAELRHDDKIETTPVVVQ